MDHSHSHNVNAALGHETREVNIKLILLSTLGMVISVLVVCFITVGIFDYLNSHQAATPPATALARPKEFPPAPRVQEHPWEEYKVLHANEARILNSYGWMDQATGTVRIPIDRAIELTAERGLPVAQQGSEAPKKANRGAGSAAQARPQASIAGKENGGK